MLTEAARFDRKISFDEFIAWVEKRNRYCITDSGHVYGKTALYRAVVRSKGDEILYLFIPRSENGRNFWSISKKITKSSNEADSSEVFNYLYCSDNNKGLGNNIRIKKGGAV